MLRVAWVFYGLSLSAGGMYVIATVVRWSAAFPQQYDTRGMIAAAVLVLALFTNIVFWFANVAKTAQPVSAPWRILIAGSLVTNVAVLFFLPFFATLPGYWLWLLAFAAMAWALLVLGADVAPEWRGTRLGSPGVPGLVWLALGLTLFWLAITVVNYYDFRHRPLRAAAVAETRLTSYVTDNAGLLQPGEKEGLQTMLSAFDRQTSNQIGVAIYRQAPAGDIDDFTIHSAERSALGRKGVDNGAILFVFLRERVARIEVGYGLEGALPDGLAWQILDRQLAPHFSRGEYAEGIESTLNAMCEVAGGEYAGKGQDKSFLAFVRHLYPPLKVAVIRIARHAWPIVRDSPLNARLGVSLFGSLLGFGIWSGIVNAAHLLWDIVVGFANLVRRRPFRSGMAPWSFEPIFDTLKVVVIFAVVAGTFVVAAGGGSYGGGGALIHWLETGRNLAR